MRSIITISTYILAVIAFISTGSKAQEEICSDLETKSSQDLRELPVCLYAGTIKIQSIQESSLSFTRLLSLDSTTSNKASKANSSSVIALELSHNFALKQVQLEELRKITGNVLIYDNTNLEKLEFSELKSMKGGMIVTANDNINNQNATSSTILALSFPEMTSFEKGNMTLHQLKSLKLPKLSSMTGDLHLHDSIIDEFDMSQLKETQGTGVISLQNVQFTRSDVFNLTSLEKMSGSLILRNVTGMQDLGAFRFLNSVDGSIVIETMYPLLNYTLQSLQTVLGSLKISAQEKLPTSQNGTGMNEQWWTCQRLKQQYKDSGIVKGKFSCSMSGMELNSDSTSTSNAVMLPTSLLTIIPLLLILLA